MSSSSGPQHDWAYDGPTASWACRLCFLRFYGPSPSLPREMCWRAWDLQTGTANATAPVRLWCSVCGADWSPTLDAYYGRDEEEAGRCVRCRAKYPKTDEPVVGEPEDV